jgi:hypothetical protein
VPPIFTRIGAVIIALALLAFLTPMAEAQSPSATGLGPFRMFLGNWSCRRTAESRGVQGFAVGEHWEIATTLTLDGRWMQSETLHRRVGSERSDFREQNDLGYDSSAERWINFQTGSDGGFDLTRSAGPKNGVIVWAEDAATAGGLPVWHASYRIVSPTRYTVHYVGPIDARGKIGFLDNTCTKIN